MLVEACTNEQHGNGGSSWLRRHAVFVYSPRDVEILLTSWTSISTADKANYDKQNDDGFLHLYRASMLVT